ncbi:MAG: hypothetical protein A3J76_02085 [Candidatus Moranbacteria bacterium RBG_13_45_13]|nr:MAG: hypothetical protein A3J76_02085 [Candidatus Moranbacteria bacterium RBG_13_45_13]
MSFFRKKDKHKTWKRKNPKIYSGVLRKESQEKKSGFSRFLFWVLLLGFTGVCGYLLLFSSFPEIDSISIEGNQSIPSEEIAGKVNEVLEGKYFNYLSKRNFFLASRKQISQKLKGDFDRLEISSVEKKFPRTLLVKVKERQPEMAWCSGGVCYLVEKDGLVYAGANATGEELNKNRFLIAIDDNARPVEIGKTIIDPGFIQYLKQMDAIIADDLELEIDGNYHTPALSSKEAIARIREGEGWFLKLNQAVSPEDTKKILQTVFDKELDGEKRKNLDYLDLRVKGKVYYKLR